MIRFTVHEDRQLVGGSEIRFIERPPGESSGTHPLSHLTDRTAHRPGNDADGLTRRRHDRFFLPGLLLHERVRDMTLFFRSDAKLGRSSGPEMTKTSTRLEPFLKTVSGTMAVNDQRLSGPL